MSLMDNISQISHPMSGIAEAIDNPNISTLTHPQLQQHAGDFLGSAINNPNISTNSTIGDLLKAGRHLPRPMERPQHGGQNMYGGSPVFNPRPMPPVVQTQAQPAQANMYSKFIG
jgi:hypothetical protein